MLWKTYHHTDIGLFSWLQWCQHIQLPASTGSGFLTVFLTIKASGKLLRQSGDHRPDLRLVAAARAGACTCRAADGDGWRREDWKNPNLKWLVSLLFRDVSNLFDVYKTFLVPSGPIHQSINLSILSIYIPLYTYISSICIICIHISGHIESLHLSHQALVIQLRLGPSRRAFWWKVAAPRGEPKLRDDNDGTTYWVLTVEV